MQTLELTTMTSVVIYVSLFFADSFLSKIYEKSHQPKARVAKLLPVLRSKFTAWASYTHVLLYPSLMTRLKVANLIWNENWKKGSSKVGLKKKLVKASSSFSIFFVFEKGSRISLGFFAVKSQKVAESSVCGVDNSTIRYATTFIDINVFTLPIGGLMTYDMMNRHFRSSWPDSVPQGPRPRDLYLYTHVQLVPSGF